MDHRRPGRFGRWKRSGLARRMERRTVAKEGFDRRELLTIGDRVLAARAAAPLCMETHGLRAETVGERLTEGGGTLDEEALGGHRGNTMVTPLGRGPRGAQYGSVALALPFPLLSNMAANSAAAATRVPAMGTKALDWVSASGE
ncbi:hypothetical protein BT96DRAFT_933093 [Gymnopus androsaceus JB14]|uniref:Uncharacterized protein n=1 Tax=Gymnopus androsaceus JB14 TaxID=1447944 RepID=A0A6A4IEX9_9AGAR|nr:hypothetical protein BT96DRAFT_933093 [Gymnopus androsaceus JB14]